ncbi:MAG: NADH-quinone oxidoreductase subunit J [Candidatus Sumerlaeia bacterium]
MITDIVFFLMAAVVLLSAGAAVLSRSIVHAAFALFFTLLGMAGLFFLLSADFLAITQIVIYVGGILILLLFGITLTHRTLEQFRIDAPRNYLVGAAVGAALFGALVGIILTAFPAAPAAEGAAAAAATGPTTGPLGRLLLTDYLLPFEFSSITLLMALVGAAYLARRRDPR